MATVRRRTRHDSNGVPIPQTWVDPEEMYTAAPKPPPLPEWPLQLFPCLAEPLTTNKYRLIHLVKDNLDKKWNWLALSSNPNIQYRDVVDNQNLPWSLMGLAANPNFTRAILIENYHVKWPLLGMKDNPTLSVQELLCGLTRKLVNCRRRSTILCELVEKRCITIEYLRANPWLVRNSDKFGLSSNPYISIHDIMANRDIGWDYEALSERPDVTEEILRQHMEDPWWWKEIFMNARISPEFIKEMASAKGYCESDINDFIVDNANIPGRHLIDGNYDFGDIEFARHPLELCDFKDAYHKIEAGEYWVCAAPNIPAEFVKEYIDDIFEMETKNDLSRNAPMSAIMDLPEYPWSWKSISCRNDLDVEFIRDNPTLKWNWSALSHGNYNYDRRIQAVITRWKTIMSCDIKIIRIQRWWRHHCYRTTRPARVDSHGRQLTGFEGFARDHLFNRSPGN